MFRADTLFVLGAASSHDFGFPLGDKLKQEIAERLAFTVDSFGRVKFQNSNAQSIYLNLTRHEIDPLTIEAALRVANITNKGVGLAKSIDHFLAMRESEPGLSRFVKAVIASIIHEYETKPFELRKDSLRQGHTLNFDKTWHQLFAQICFEDVTQEMLPVALKNISVVNFNYDRSFEQFVKIALARLYSLDWSTASELAKNLVVTHPYGLLRWPSQNGLNSEIEFGQEGISNFELVGEGIRTFTEQNIDPKTLAQLTGQVRNADVIVFLGFGYHKRNLEILEPSFGVHAREVYGTAHKVAKSARDKLKLDLRRMFGRWSNGECKEEAQINLDDMTCLEFLEEYGSALQQR